MNTLNFFVENWITVEKLKFLSKGERTHFIWTLWAIPLAHSGQNKLKKT